MWEFAVALLFIDVFPSSIFLVSLFGFAEAAAITLFGSIVGGWVDFYPRLWRTYTNPQLRPVQNTSLGGSLSCCSCALVPCGPECPCWPVSCGAPHADVVH